MVSLSVMQQSSSLSAGSFNKGSFSGHPSGVSVEESVDDAVDKLKSNLVRYARSNDRRMVLRSLREANLFGSLSLESASSPEGPLFNLEKEVAEQSITINGIVFEAVKAIDDGTRPSHTKHNPIGLKNSCVPLLKGLCKKICDREGVKNSSREIYEKVVVRLAKTTGGADPYFRLNSMLGSTDLMVMPMSKMTGNVAKTTLRLADTQSFEEEQAKKLELNLYESEGNVHAMLKEPYSFGLFRKSDIPSGKPWITLKCNVHERVNLSNDESVRTLKVELPDLY